MHSFESVAFLAWLFYFECLKAQFDFILFFYVVFVAYCATKNCGLLSLLTCVIFLVIRIVFLLDYAIINI